MSKHIVAGYIRVASLEQGKGDPVKRQKEVLNRLAKKHGLTIDHF